LKGEDPIYRRPELNSKIVGARQREYLLAKRRKGKELLGRIRKEKKEVKVHLTKMGAATGGREGAGSLRTGRKVIGKLLEEVV